MRRCDKEKYLELMQDVVKTLSTDDISILSLEKILDILNIDLSE